MSRFSSAAGRAAAAKSAPRPGDSWEFQGARVAPPLRRRVAAGGSSAAEEPGDDFLGARVPELN